MIWYYYNGSVLCVSDNLTLLSVTLSVLSDCGLYRDRGQGFNYNTVSNNNGRSVSPSNLSRWYLEFGHPNSCTFLLFDTLHNQWFHWIQSCHMTHHCYSFQTLQDAIIEKSWRWHKTALCKPSKPFKIGSQSQQSCRTAN